MLQWMLYWVWWIGWRIVVSLACMYTLQHLMHEEGYYVSMTNMLSMGAVMVVAIRIWSAQPNREEKHDARSSLS